MKNFLLILAVVVLVALPLFIYRSASNEEIFAGADAQAEQAISKINPDYKPWFKPLWEPPSSEVETMLFALQAALGAGLIGYYLGLARGRAERSGMRKCCM